MNKIKRLIVTACLILIFVPALFSGDYNQDFIKELNRSHVVFNAIRLSGSISLFATVPYFLIDESTPLKYENAAYMVFTPGLVLSSLAYGSWLKQDISYFYRGYSTDSLLNYHNALAVMKNETDYSRVIGSMGVNSFLLVLGALMTYWGNADSTDWKENIMYSAGLGLTIQSSLLLTLDLTELFSRLVRKEKVHKAWIRLNI